MSPDSALEVVIVDDHRLLADSLAMALAAHGVRASVLDVTASGDLADRVAAHRPHLVLLDLDLGDGGDGSRLVRPLVEAGLRILLVTAATDPDAMARAVGLGALGVVAKNGPFTTLVETILAAARGSEVMTPAERLRLLDEARSRRAEREAALAPFSRLTEREREVLHELTRGHAVATIARRAVVSEATVRSQVRAILMKLGARTQLEAVVAARRAGWDLRAG